MLTSSSFKLQKLTRSTQYHSSSLTKQPQTPRLSHMNSIAKSVKYNNLSFITGEQLCKLRREPEDGIEDPEYLEGLGNMAGVRKRYDKANQQRLYFQNKITRLQEQANKLKQQQDQLQDNKKNGNKSVSQMQSQLQQMRLKYQQREFQKKSLLQQCYAIEQDKIIYSKRRFNMQKLLHHLSLKKSSINQKNLHISEQDDRVHKIYQKLTTRLSAQQSQRQQHINSMDERIMQKSNLNGSMIMRKSIMGTIASKAMTDLSKEEKQWKEVYATHKFIDKMLKFKIQREMNKFHIVQTSFKTIKIATGVTDAKTMVTKFLSKQQIYGDLLSKIAENQKQIQLLKSEQHQLLKQIKQSEQTMDLLDFSKGSGIDFRLQMKEAEFMDEKRKRAQLEQQKLRQFLFKNQKQLNNNLPNTSQQHKVANKQQKQVQVSSKQMLKSRLIAYLKKTSQLLESSVLIESPQHDQATIPSQQSSQSLSLLFRIKPFIKLSIDNQGNTKQQSSQYVQQFQEQEITQASDDVQAMQDQRINVIKNNQKFMKDLKYKRDEQKKLIVENLVKNNKEKVILPVKKVQATVQ